MSKEFFRTELFLPAQAAAETEATITSWRVQEGSSFEKGQVLADVESAKSTFEFEAPCSGKVITILVPQNATIPFENPVLLVETDDRAVFNTNSTPVPQVPQETIPQAVPAIVPQTKKPIQDITLLSIGAYLPERIVTNKELLIEHADIDEEYIFGVTGIRKRHWAGEGEKPSDMAYQAAKLALERANIDSSEIDGIIVSTTTPDVVMPSTACILQEKLGIRGVLSFDLNAACSGWLYAISSAKGLILSGLARNILIVAVDMQSKLLDKKDRDTYFIFGDGAGATVVSGVRPGHKILTEYLSADSAGLHLARREFPGFSVPLNQINVDPWVRLDGKALFRFATVNFAAMVNDLTTRSGWQPSDVRWVVPHQANGRILKAAAQRSGVPFERFYLNIDHVGNTSSASIPIALSEIYQGIQKGDKLIFCTVGAGITAAGMSIEW